MTSGELDWSGGSSGSAVLDRCSSGQPYDFNGVVLTSTGSPDVEVRVRRDAITEEYAVRVDTEGGGGPGGVVLRTGSRDCDTFEASVENDGGYNQTYTSFRRGNLTLVCRDSRGRRITARATFERCN